MIKIPAILIIVFCLAAGAAQARQLTPGEVVQRDFQAPSRNFSRNVPEEKLEPRRSTPFEDMEDSRKKIDEDNKSFYEEQDRQAEKQQRMRDENDERLDRQRREWDDDNNSGPRHEGLITGILKNLDKQNKTPED